MEGHPYAKRLSEDEFNLVADLTRMNVAPRGLPCACELSKYISSHQYVPLDSIDIFWRKLDISPSTSLQSVKKESEPQVERKTRGRPSLKKSQQKRCDKKEPTRHSSFEFDLNKEPMIDWTEIPDEPARHSSYVIDLNEVPLMDCLDMLVDIPKVLLVVCLGLDEDRYYEYVRQMMREELQSRYDIYANIFVSDVNSLYQDLCFFGSPCPEVHRMKMPEAGVQIANKFGAIVHSLSMSVNTTIFLFWSGPEEIQHHRALTIALVNDENHYLMVELQGGYPMPTITSY